MGLCKENKMPGKNLAFIDSVNELAAMPIRATELKEMIQNQSTSLKDITAKIKLDPALASFVLRTAGLAFYEIDEELRSIETAVEKLGLSEIRSTLTSYFLRHLFLNSEKTHVMENLWEHSVSVAVFAEELAILLNIKEEGAYLGGLLHDIGKQVLYLHAPDKCEEIIRKVDERGGDFLELEEQTFGFTHTDAGYYLSQKWNLPDFIQNTTLFHHYYISYSGKDPVIGIVAFANQLVHKYIDRSPISLDSYMEKYGIYQDELIPFVDKVLEKIAHYHMVPDGSDPPQPTPPPPPKKIQTAEPKPGETKTSKKTISRGFLDVSAASERRKAVESLKEGPRLVVKDPQEDSDFHGDPRFGVPIFELDEKGQVKKQSKKTPAPEPQKEPAPEIPGGAVAEGVKLFLQLEKLKTELSQLERLYLSLDYVPLKTLQAHGEMVKLFTESIDIMVRDPKMSAILKAARLVKKQAMKKAADKKAEAQNKVYETAADEIAGVMGSGTNNF